MDNPWGWIIGGLAAIGGLIIACSTAEESAQKTQDELDRRRREWENDRQQKERQIELLKQQQSLEAKQTLISIELSTLRNDLENFRAQQETCESAIEKLSPQIRESFDAKKKYKESLSQIATPRILIQEKISKSFNFPNITEYFQKYQNLLEKIRDLAKHCQTLLAQKEEFKKRLEDAQRMIADIESKIRQIENGHEILPFGISSAAHSIVFLQNKP